MPVTALFLKVLRIVLEYGVLFWLVWFILRLVRSLFHDYARKADEAVDKGTVGAAASLAVVEAEEKDLAGKLFSFPSQIKIGRGGDNDVVIPEGFVSHHHAVIYRHGSQFVVEDLGSRNHTFVNGQILQGRAYLRSGDLIRIGMVTFRFER